MFRKTCVILAAAAFALTLGGCCFDFHGGHHHGGWGHHGRGGRCDLGTANADLAMASGMAGGAVQVAAR